jgi:hypothetical protein
MLEDQDSEFILGIFLMEAWDTVAAVEEGVRRLAAGEAVSSGVLDPLVIVAHRLKGAAALHGYPVVSAVALVLEEMIEKLPASPDGERSRRVEVLADVVATVKRMLELIGDDGREDVEAVVRLRARHPELFAPPAPPGPSREPVRLAEPGPAATLDAFPTSPPSLPPPSLPPSSIGDSVSADEHGPAGGGAASSDPAALSPSAAAPHLWASAAPVEEAVAEGLLRELERFFAEHAESVPYFAPEAAEHLDVMTRSLLVLEQSDLRARGSTWALPVVVLTSRAGAKHVNLARRLGIEHFVTKPVDEAAFVRLIESLKARAAGFNATEATS